MIVYRLYLECRPCVYVWSGLYRCVLEGTHVCRHSTLQKAIWCLLPTQHSPSFSLTVCHFLSTSLFRPAAETRAQFAPGLMQCYGHSNKSHTWMPGTHTHTHARALFQATFFVVILNSWLCQNQWGTSRVVSKNLSIIRLCYILRHQRCCSLFMVGWMTREWSEFSVTQKAFESFKAAHCDF